MRALAYISDEMYLAIADADAEFQSIQDGSITVLRSSPSGAIYGELPDGQYRVTLAKDGYGAKTVMIAVGEAAGPAPLVIEQTRRIRLAEVGARR